MNVSQIRFDEENNSLQLDGEQLHCGDCLKVLVFNGLSGTAEWVDTRLELDGNDNWYLVNCLGYQVSGLFARRSEE